MNHFVCIETLKTIRNRYAISLEEKDGVAKETAALNEAIRVLENVLPLARGAVGQLLEIRTGCDFEAECWTVAEKLNCALNNEKYIEE